MSSVLRKTTWVSQKWQAQLVKMDKICIKREAVVSYILWYTKKICPIFTQMCLPTVLGCAAGLSLPIFILQTMGTREKCIRTHTHKQTQAKYHFHIQLVKMSNDQFLSQKSIELIISK